MSDKTPDIKTDKYKPMTTEYKSMEEKLTSEALQEVNGQELTTADKAEVMTKCDISDRTLARYLKGEIGNMLVAKNIVAILRRRIKARKTFKQAS